ncbi:MAG: acetylornithine deacetylase/succinyl-diaminopimelate desuccinylase-like protein [Bradymonadia bacterium]|jgi:acetylornithine deacetylase/succinyl-diaminopimelate desuccinylase-like protein
MGRDQDVTERDQLEEMIREIERDFPVRRAGGEDERRAQERLRDKLDAIGVENRFQSFRWNESLYATMALHFGISAIGTLLAPSRPLLAAALHLTAGVSYWADSSRTGLLLRRLLPSKRSQNLVATLPAKEERKLRIVLLAHCDAAFTGWVFDPRVLKRAGGGRTGESQPYHARSMEMATDAVFASGLLAVVRAFLDIAGFGLFRAVELVLGIPALLVFAVNAQVVLKNQTVPGAADNLSGVAALFALLERWRATPLPDDVEIVFAFTGSEEAGTGGAHRLMQERRDEWSKEDTIVVGVDTVTNGDLRWFVEGEMSAVPVDPVIVGCLRETIASSPDFAAVRPYRIPVGATDVMPFVSKGYKGVAIGCVDTDYGAPRHYHHPSDTADNLDFDQLVQSVDFIDEFVKVLIRSQR